MTATDVLDGVRSRLLAASAGAGPRLAGRVRSVVGLAVEVEGLDGAIGDAVSIEPGPGRPTVTCEVVALRPDAMVCLPLGELQGIRAGSSASTTSEPLRIDVGPQLLGRVLDGLGRPLDGGPDLGLDPGAERVGVTGRAPHPLLRAPVDRPLPLGVRVLDTLVPCGRGQRIGIMAGSGVGKSSLLSMIARGTDADISVIALIGERGREVGEFLGRDLGAEGLARSVVVVATSDEPALVRLQAARTATRIAEWFRDAGRDVVLMMDSVTRFCMAQREVGLAAGEPPATRGYPPSVFAELPRLLERAGTSDVGSITGLYTVLVDGDDMNEPIADATRSILDGHVVLDRTLAAAGHFPCVDVLGSVSRVAGAITGAQQRRLAQELRRLLAALKGAQDLIEIGAYQPGSNPEVDRAVLLREHLEVFLCQDIDAVAPYDHSWAALEALLRIA